MSDSYPDTEVINLTIGECNRCGDQVKECTQWDVSIELGFTCENCNKPNIKSHKSYMENAAWFKEYNREISKQLRD